jgi:hypothetical protein
MEESEYFGTTLTNENSIQEEIRIIFKPWNACCTVFGAESFVGLFGW